MALLLATGLWYVTASLVATFVSILVGFAGVEFYVFRDRRESGAMKSRAIKSIGYNAADTVVRLALLAILVESLAIPPLLAQVFTIGLAFFFRYGFHSRFVYGGKPS